MITATEVLWRPVTGEDVFRIECSGIFGRGCSSPVLWCRQWKSPQMSGPAFYYYCGVHGAEGAKEWDGVDLLAGEREPKNDPRILDAPTTAKGKRLEADALLEQASRKIDHARLLYRQAAAQEAR